MATLSYDRSPGSGAKDTSSAHLFVAMACATPLEGASRHLLDDLDDVHIGRGAAARSTRTNEAGRRVLRLALADSHASTSHARISRGSNGWTLEDLGSKNGSFVNGIATKNARLADGDLLLVGRTLLVFRAAIPTPPASKPDVSGGAETPAFATLIPTLARDLDALATVARTEIPILLLSETGTGKEVLARAIHSLSGRSGAFVPVNCGALPSTLADSVLFGHKRGAFSGATADHVGLLRSADGGTLLLDEIGDMPLALQPALLRALQEGEVQPVGATTSVRLRARFISATHHDLERNVGLGSFREDLLARLAGYVFRLPPLRERREDIGLLAGAILRRVEGGPKAISPEAAALLFRYSWPRNVRELEKCLTRAALFAEHGEIAPAHLPPELRNEAQAQRASPKTIAPHEADTRAHLVALLATHRGNLAAVAAELGTSRSQLHRQIKRFAIDLEKFRS